MISICKNKKCNKEFDSSVIAEIDPSPDIDCCSNTCYHIYRKQQTLARDKRKTLHVKPDTYELFIQATKKLTDAPFSNLDEKVSDDKILFSILSSYLRDV
jgi:hypothetical protein